MRRRSAAGWGETLHGAFRRDEDGVSPVISTILMVAITVVLAATAFVLVADVGGNSVKAAPQFGLRAEEALDRVEVTTLTQGADWQRLSIVLSEDSGTGSVFLGTDAAGGYMNEPAAATGANLASKVVISANPSPMSAGDFLEFCRAAGTDGFVRVNIVDETSGSMIHAGYPVGNVPANSC